MIHFEKVNKVLEEVESHLLREKSVLNYDDGLDVRVVYDLEHAIDSIESCKSYMRRVLEGIEEAHPMSLRW